jgi:predicted DNA-binding transcriptional regulator AlpA
MSASNDNDQLNLTIVPPQSATSEQSSTMSDLIDEPALAARLGVSRSTLQSWRYAGRGPRYIKLGRIVRYRNADVDAYLRANTRGTAA